MSAPPPRPAPLALAASLSLMTLLGSLAAGCGDDATQCERDGSPQACARACASGVVGQGGCLRLGDLYASGERVWQSAQVAAMYHEIACKAGEAQGCERLAKAPPAEGRAAPQGSAAGPAAPSAPSPSASGSPSSSASGPGGGAPSPPDGSPGQHPGRCPPGGADAELPEALRPIEARCQAGDGVSCGVVAERLSQGVGVPRDRARAAKLWAMGCERHDAASCRAAGRAYEKGRGVEVDLTQAMALYQRACLGAFVAGCAALGHLSLSGAPGAPPVNMGVGHLQKACDRAYGPACLTMAKAIREGKQVPPNAAVAERLATRGLEILDAGCKRGEAESCSHQIRFLEETGNADGATQAESRLAAACTGGDPAACSVYLDLPEHRSPPPAAALQAACAANVGQGCLRLAQAARHDPSLGSPSDLLDRACQLGAADGPGEPGASPPAGTSGAAPSAPASAGVSAPALPSSMPSAPPPPSSPREQAAPGLPPLPDEPAPTSCAASPRPSAPGASALSGLALALAAAWRRRR